MTDTRQGPEGAEEELAAGAAAAAAPPAGAATQAATQAATDAAASAASAAAPASEAASQASRAISTAQTTVSSAQGIASGVQQGGVGGAMASASGAAGLAGVAAPAAGASAGARETLSSVQQGVAVAQQASSLGQSVIPPSSSSSSVGSSGGSAASTAQAAVAALLGPEGEGITVSFTTDSSVGTIWNASQISISESLSAPYVAHLSLVTHDVHAEPADLLGASCTISLERGSIERLLHGIVEEVTTGAESTREAHTSTCTIRVVPALALLAHTRRSRIFQEMTVVEILDEVLTEALQGFQRTVRIEVERAVPTYEYRTQYDESDLSFVQRLLSEEGLFYFFDQSGSEEELVIVDDASKYPALVSTQGDRLPFVNAGSPGNHEAVTAFHRSDRMQATVLSLRHYDWTKAAVVEAKQAAASGDDPDAPGASRGSSREIYEHDSAPTTLSKYDTGAFKYTAEDSAAQVSLRRHRSVQDARTFDGDSTCIGLAAGVAFTLTGHSRGELDGEYAVVRASHSITVGDASQSHGSAARLEATYSNHFVCVPADVPFRHVRGVDKPRVRGILTARVVGPKGDEIHTDHYGRIKVQFHWDRDGQEDDKSSCFLRVAQPWAGEGWGFVFIPRIGMEVIVTFVDGDPDRPVVTGTLYNAENQPPYPLPDEMTKSTIKTNSSPGGKGYNELTFEDKKDAEQIILHAQKDLNETVENAHSTTVKGSQTNSVGGDRSVSVSGKQTTSVKKERTTTIEGDDTHTVADGKTYTFQLGTSKITITNGKIEITTGQSTLTMDGATVDLKSHSGGQVYLTDNALMQSHAGSKVKLDAAADLKSSKNGQVYLTGDALMQSDGGKATVHLTSDAEMQGANATVHGKSKAQVSSMMVEVAGSTGVKVSTGGSSVETTPAGTTVMGTAVTVQGSGNVTITGPMVAVN